MIAPAVQAASTRIIVGSRQVDDGIEYLDDFVSDFNGMGDSDVPGEQADQPLGYIGLATSGRPVDEQGRPSSLLRRTDRAALA